MVSMFDRARSWLWEAWDLALWIPGGLRSGLLCHLRGHQPMEMWTVVATGETVVWCARCRAELPSRQKGLDHG